MLTDQEQERIRQTVRRSLDNILGDWTPARDAPAGGENPDLERLTEAERIIEQETERYYQAKGLVKHVSRSGQVFWVTPRERDRLEQRRRRSKRSWLNVDPKVALIWTVSLLFAVLVVAYLVSSESISGLLVQ